MNIRLNKVHFPVEVLGPGRRLGIWLQGCRIHCAGCCSHDTWDEDDRRLVPLEQLLTACRRLAGDALDGVSVSGGEPFDQPGPFAALLDGLADWRRETGSDFDLLAFSGYPLERLEREHAGVLARLDAIVPEPFVRSHPPAGPWRGSDNQPLVLLSERGKRRYSEAALAMATPAMQIAVVDDRVWMIGIPRPGDLERLEEAAARAGIRFAEVSWCA